MLWGGKLHKHSSNHALWDRIFCKGEKGSNQEPNTYRSWRVSRVGGSTSTTKHVENEPAYWGLLLPSKQELGVPGYIILRKYFPSLGFKLSPCNKEAESQRVTTYIMAMGLHQEWTQRKKLENWSRIPYKQKPFWPVLHYYSIVARSKKILMAPL